MPPLFFFLSLCWRSGEKRKQRTEKGRRGQKHFIKILFPVYGNKKKEKKKKNPKRNGGCPCSPANHSVTLGEGKKEENSKLNFPAPHIGIPLAIQTAKAAAATVLYTTRLSGCSRRLSRDLYTSY